MFLIKKERQQTYFISFSFGSQRNNKETIFGIFFSANIKGISSLSSCADPERLPELPPGEEKRLQRAAFHLQQKLILREWLKENRLEQHYTRYFPVFSLNFSFV